MQGAGSAEAPIDVLERFYEAEVAYMQAGGPGNASFDGLAATLDPDVVMHQAEGLPYSGDWRGHKGIEQFFGAMAEAYDRFDVRDPRFFPEGDTVVVLCRLIVRARATGTELDAPMAQVIRVRDGRIVDFRPFYWDTAAVKEACTPPMGQSPAADEVGGVQKE